MQGEERFFVEVLGGEDHGTRLWLVAGEAPRTIGRSRDADLALRDVSVSRRHLLASATESGVKLEANPDAAPFLVEGRALRSLVAKSGDKVLVGATVLAVGSRAPDSPAKIRRTATGQMDVQTVLTGVGGDVLAMAALHALIEALDTATAVGPLEQALRSWTSDQTPQSAVEIRQDAEAQVSAAITEQSTEDGTVIAVPAPSDEPVTLLFTTRTRAENVTNSFRRMLVLAGRLFGSSLARVRRLEVADGEVAALRALSFGTAHNFLGSSVAAKDLAARIPKLAGSDVSLLVEGETGVGKTFVARLVHEASARAKEPLRVINCAAIPENLLESELFGHERGAFTGAVAAKAGAMEAAGRGTLFLDEVGELTLASQAKLLRVVEERKFERVGSNRSIDFRARLICATNRDLQQLVAAGQFRQDLLFRIAVVRVRVPSLRERLDDVPQLAEQLLADAARSAGRRVRGFSPEAVEALRRNAWPGNVRELRNAIEHAVALGESAVVVPGDLPPALVPAAAPQSAEPDVVHLPLDLATLERRAIEAALRATGQNRNRAAILLGLPRSTLYNKLKEYGIT